MADTLFSSLSDDVVLNIFSKLEDDPRHWARLACVCTKFSSLVRNVCWKAKCCANIPSIVADLAAASSSSSSSSSPPGGWSSLHKVAVCCPGLLHAGVLLENSDFGLERELGPNENYSRSDRPQPESSSLAAADADASSSSNSRENSEPVDSCPWSLYDDLYFDTVYNTSESQEGVQLGDEDEDDDEDVAVTVERGYVKVGGVNGCKRRKIWRSMRSHLASGVWNLSREEGNKLLASRFRGDCLYICNWPGCIHMEEKRNYMLFRGVFKNFKRSMVWRTINDGNRSKIDLNCAFCSCKETWDLHSAFCLRRSYGGYHDDGEPVVRAYVCENGHVSGAWTNLPLYT